MEWKDLVVPCLVLKEESTRKKTACDSHWHILTDRLHLYYGKNDYHLAVSLSHPQERESLIEKVNPGKGQKLMVPFQ